MPITYWVLRFNQSFHWSAFTAILALSLLSGSTAIAQEAPSANQTVEDDQVQLNRIRELLKQLESDELAKRDEAETELIKLGKVSLKFLPSVTPKTSGEMKVRLLRIRKELESAEIETHFEASKLTLQGKHKLSDVFDKIREQTGNSVKLQGGDDAAAGDVELDWQDTPFWTAIDSLISKKNLRILSFATTESELVLANSNNSELPAPSVSGPFRVDVNGVESQRTFGTQLEGLTRVSYTFSWEPRLEPVFMQIPMQSVKAFTPDDKEVLASNPSASPEIRLNGGGSSAQIDIQLARIDRKHETLKSIQGQFVISVPAERHKYEFKKFVSGKKQVQRFGDVGVTLEGAQKNGRVYELRLFVEFGDSQGALDSFRGWILSNRAYVLDTNDKQLENVGFQTYGASEKGVGVSYMFQLNNDPDSYRLIYESPSSIKRQTINYELKNIPLP